MQDEIERQYQRDLEAEIAYLRAKLDEADRIIQVAKVSTDAHEYGSPLNRALNEWVAKKGES